MTGLELNSTIVYPTCDTIWYWGYCYSAHHNSNFHSFTIWCSTQLSFAFLGFATMFAVLFLLYIEVRIQQQIAWSKPVKFIALTLMAITELVVFLHYFLTWCDPTWFKLMTITQQFLISMVFLFLCYLFAKNSTKILPGRRKWLTISKVVGGVAIAGNVFIFCK